MTISEIEEIIQKYTGDKEKTLGVSVRLKGVCTLYDPYRPKGMFSKLTNIIDIESLVKDNHSLPKNELANLIIVEIFNAFSATRIDPNYVHLATLDSPVKHLSLFLKGPHKGGDSVYWRKECALICKKIKEYTRNTWHVQVFQKLNDYYDF